MENDKSTIEIIARESTKILGSDIHPVSLDERINVTPVNDVEWSGLRGQSFCKSTSPEVQEMLAQYGEKGIQYTLKGAPDFGKVAIAKVKISDMTEDMGHDRAATIHKLLDTDFAKNNGITTPTEMQIYIKEHDLTIHEDADGVTEYLIDRKIHQTFRHYGGRGKIRGFENPDLDRVIYSKLSEGAVSANKAIVKGTEVFDKTIADANDFVADQASKFVSANAVELNKAGMESAMKTAAFAATLSVTRNTLNVAKGDIELKDAAKEVVVDTSSAAVIAYASGVTAKALGIQNRSDAALLVTGTVQISKQLISYMSGEIDETQFLENVAETTAYLAAAYVGKAIGGTIGSAAGPIGTMVGQYIGEVITTAVCSEVISTIKFNKEFDKENDRVKSLYRNAENEIRNSQARLEQVIQKENEELKNAICTGFENIIIGIQNNSFEQVENGLITIGEKFNLSAEVMKKDKVTRKTLFHNLDDELIIE